MSSQRRQSSMRLGSRFFSLKLWSGGSPVGRTWSVFSKRLFLVLDWILTVLLLTSYLQVSERKTRRDGDAASEGSPTRASNHQSEDEDAASVGKRGDLEVVDGEGPPFTSDGYFSLRHYDSASMSSFSLDTPSLPRKLHSQEDTDSLVSTGTLVPEAIYLPPAGHRLVTHSDWDALNAQVRTQTLILTWINILFSDISSLKH